jgi:ParB/RepB/Spo0J family partition protein
MAPLEVILANPYQPRQGEDMDHVQSLAVSISEKGLLQIPVGRLVDKDGIPISLDNMQSWQDLMEGDLQEVLKQTGWQVQLACGHSRLAAYRLLKGAGNKGFDCMPVMLDDLDDAGMFETALIENVQRRNLTPVEEATAMKRLRDEFKMASPEIGKLFGLGDSAVRNKMRLLNLPEELRQKLSEHVLSESAARALLELFDLPEELRQKAEKHFYDRLQPSQIVKAALSGETAENILEDISRIIGNYSQDLSKAAWKWDEVFSGDPNLEGACKNCQFLVKNDKKSLCIKGACFAADEHGWHSSEFQWPPPNVWIGVSVEDQETADKRIPLLLQTPAVVRFVSYEPALGEINFDPYFLESKAVIYGPGEDDWDFDIFPRDGGPDWLIMGCESGPGARPMNIEWARSVKNQCVEAGVPFFFKQQMVWDKLKHMPSLDGQQWAQFPEVK